MIISRALASARSRCPVNWPASESAANTQIVLQSSVARSAGSIGDCGIYNVGTLQHARRHGLGTAVTARLAHDAAARGCETASLQSTEMAERIYAGVGFRDLGRILEYVPR